MREWEGHLHTVEAWAAPGLGGGGAGGVALAGLAG